MSAVQLRDLAVGDALPPLVLPAVDRTTLALFAGASGDHNPIHIDVDYARKAGMADVFAHGMLPAAYIGRLLTQWVPQQQLRRLGLRFVGITHLGHQLTCSATVTRRFREGGAEFIQLELQACTQYGDRKITGDAVIALEGTGKA